MDFILVSLLKIASFMAKVTKRTIYRYNNNERKLQRETFLI